MSRLGLVRKVLFLIAAMNVFAAPVYSEARSTILEEAPVETPLDLPTMTSFGPCVPRYASTLSGDTLDFFWAAMETNFRETFPDVLDRTHPVFFEECRSVAILSIQPEGSDSPVSVMLNNSSFSHLQSGTAEFTKTPYLVFWERWMLLGYGYEGIQ
ncbi:hypothetical protein [Marivivens marinus]|uniref:hypothetical protein n=1 Tax=Marivivens marinus TaxID=3110173 RepID=UPI003B845C03